VSLPHPSIDCNTIAVLVVSVGFLPFLPEYFPCGLKKIAVYTKEIDEPSNVTNKSFKKAIES
jgi:hypothetical protein